MTKEIICNHCGLTDDYRTEKKSNNLVAYCNGCDKYIKNIPYAEPAFYFGKYKGIKISECTDIQYMKWFVGNVKNYKQLTEVKNRILELEFIAK